MLLLPHVNLDMAELPPYRVRQRRALCFEPFANLFERAGAHAVVHQPEFQVCLLLKEVFEAVRDGVGAAGGGAPLSDGFSAELDFGDEGFAGSAEGLLLVYPALEHGEGFVVRGTYL